MKDDDAVASTPSPKGNGDGADHAQPSSGRRILGGILLVIGVLLVVISGLCTAAFIVMGVVEGDVAMAITTGPVFGGPFILVGALLWWGGRSLRK